MYELLAMFQYLIGTDRHNWNDIGTSKHFICKDLNKMVPITNKKTYIIREKRYNIYILQRLYIYTCLYILRVYIYYVYIYSEKKYIIGTDYANSCIIKYLLVPIVVPIAENGIGT